MRADDFNITTECIYEWFIGAETLEGLSMSDFSERLKNSNNMLKRSNPFYSLPFETIKTKSNLSLYYGIEGKREVVVRFLSIILEKKKSGDILLYSNESLDWLTQDKHFQEIWMDLLCRAIGQGNRIKIIHNVSRNLDEMLEALSKWIPIYMTGAVEAFYYPKKRDGLFNKTMFIAPGKAAISANSFVTMSDNVTSILFQEKKPIESLLDEFNCYLSLCKPLMHIFTDNNRSAYVKMLDDFQKELEKTMIKTESLSLFTMPDHIVTSILERADIKNKDEIESCFTRRKKAFLASLENNEFNEIIKIDVLSNIKEDFIKIGYTSISELSEVKYMPLEYREHLKNIINLLETYENYNVVIDRGNHLDDYRIYIKENIGVIVEKTTKPQMLFAISEGNISAAFWDYLDMIFDQYKEDKSSVIKQLKDIVDKIEGA